jgi:hypothetical protein
MAVRCQDPALVEMRPERGGFALTMSAVRADGGTLFDEEDESPFVGLL